MSTERQPLRNWELRHGHHHVIDRFDFLCWQSVPPDPGRASSGLSSTEAQRRLSEFGSSEIRREPATSALTLLVRQFASPVIWLLLVATVLSAGVGEWLDAIAIGAIVILNAVIGFFQEHRAERAVMALRSMTAPRARVMRDGHSVMMPASGIVPGDVTHVGSKFLLTLVGLLEPRPGESWRDLCGFTVSIAPHRRHESMGC